MRVGWGGWLLLSLDLLLRSPVERGGHKQSHHDLSDAGRKGPRGQNVTVSMEPGVQSGELFSSTSTSHLPAQVEYRPVGRLDGMISAGLRCIFMN